MHKELLRALPPNIQVKVAGAKTPLGRTEKINIQWEAVVSKKAVISFVRNIQKLAEAYKIHQ